MRYFVRTAFVVASTAANRHFYSPIIISSPVSLLQKMASSHSWSETSTEQDPSKTGVLGIDYPELVVFDLDACLWDKEMFEMPALPNPKNVVRGDLNGRGEGITGVYSGRHELISLHEGALVALQEQYDKQQYPGMKMALASSANTPFAEKIGRASLKLLEVVPGTSVWDLLMRDWDGKDVNQIGRQPPKLSPNKAKSHFPNIHEMTGIPFSRMLFFDDCNWGDHVGAVERGCKEPDGQGVTGYRTPYGLGVSEWREGMRKYAEQHRQQQ